MAALVEIIQGVILLVALASPGSCGSVFFVDTQVTAEEGKQFSIRVGQSGPITEIINVIVQVITFSLRLQQLSFQKHVHLFIEHAINSYTLNIFSEPIKSVLGQQLEPRLCWQQSSGVVRTRRK